MSKHKRPSIAIIYTGGTIGMIQDADTHALRPVNFKHISEHVPEIKRFNLDIIPIPFGKPIDSTNMSPAIWKELALLIKANYNKFDGFVILHGSDTMSYTASALSFMLENLSKPVVLTGSQLPIGVVRTDGKENLLTSIEIASACDKSGKPLVPEVCIYFEYQLYRGNRTHKYSAEHFKAFESPNYPVLAQAGVSITYHSEYIQAPPKKAFQVHANLDLNLAIMYLYPGVNEHYLESFLSIKNLKALIVCTFGSGNFPADKTLTKTIQALCKNDVVVVNVTQCNMGVVDQHKYATNPILLKAGIIDGADITLEAAITKLMFLLGQKLSLKELKQQFQKPLRGEMTLPR